MKGKSELTTTEFEKTAVGDRRFFCLQFNVVEGNGLDINLGVMMSAKIKEWLWHWEAGRDVKRPKEGRYKDLHRAIIHASRWHAGQDRKYSEVPYLVHPLRVMQIVRTVTDDEKVLIAAVFHDVFEDTKLKRKTMYKLYGQEVVELVEWMSDVSTPEDGNRAVRKRLDLIHTAAAPEKAQTLKLADLIDNSRSIVANDPSFAKVFMAEFTKLLVVLTKGDAYLLWEARAIVAEYNRKKII